MPIANTNQKVTDKYRNNPFWDKKKLKETAAMCFMCGSPLTPEGHCIDLLEQQKR